MLKTLQLMWKIVFSISFLIYYNNLNSEDIIKKYNLSSEQIKVKHYSLGLSEQEFPIGGKYKQEIINLLKTSKPIDKLSEKEVFEVLSSIYDKYMIYNIYKATNTIKLTPTVKELSDKKVFDVNFGEKILYFYKYNFVSISKGAEHEWYKVPGKIYDIINERAQNYHLWKLGFKHPTNDFSLYADVNLKGLYVYTLDDTPVIISSSCDSVRFYIWSPDSSLLSLLFDDNKNYSVNDGLIGFFNKDKNTVILMDKKTENDFEKDILLKFDEKLNKNEHIYWHFIKWLENDKAIIKGYHSCFEDFFIIDGHSGNILEKHVGGYKEIYSSNIDAQKGKIKYKTGYEKFIFYKNGNLKKKIYDIGLYGPGQIAEIHYIFNKIGKLKNIEVYKCDKGFKKILFKKADF
ncbi:MAG TPA: hypothetical protein DCX95_06635 [Elusimicrobia bacterium]|nr:hypothetical protein [Elusimicrobiota bacterium]